MDISLIVALANERVIGKLGTIPWELSHDMLWFKYHTLNKPIIMGRKTFDSIGKKPLLNRFNIVLSRSLVQNRYASDLVFVSTPEEALWISAKICNYFISEVMVIGGAQIYDLFLPYVNHLYITYINMNVFGDVFFPSYREGEWNEIFTRSYCLFPFVNYTYCFKIFERCVKYYYNL
ncbi:dihydrofolate reductase [Blochmannia endosymbiont of Polyrhachis (Hedomyrma) turneri]|uniref:dihydrofolate reductase n=1 Tax=Blochmannia endosymbiont of Polyrhachis (Hedomyrma) turneri TaxID=1505596 RepID=UPI00061A89B0|nr:dihydrofolate reductase [Blochmannia endosymbiont of Polyrhachis (Hedomyrma) turneri]AKC59707.1 Dihydrofolate reductase [Blochmannia endosymbiont of Polyrhachis (Hedomyrma) turneri]